MQLSLAAVALGVISALSPVAALALMVLVGLALLLTVGWRYMPFILLPLIYYLPGQVVPGGALEQYIYIRWFTLVLIPVLLLAFTIRMIATRQKLRAGFVIVPLMAFTAVTIASTLINGDPLTKALAYLAMYIRYPLLFIIIANLRVNQRMVTFFVAEFIALTLLQLPEVAFRSIVQGVSYDAISFTLGPWGHVFLGVFAAYAMCIFAARIVAIRFSLGYFIVILALMAIAIPGEIKALLLAGPVCVAFILLYPHKGAVDLRLRILMVLAMISFFIALLFAWKIFWADYDVLTPFFEMVYRFFTDNSLWQASINAVQSGQVTSEIGLANRFGWLMLAIIVIASTGSTWLGLGPGTSFAGNSFLSDGSSDLSPLLQLIPQTSQVAAMLMDVGVIGLITFGWLLVRVFRWIHMTLRDSTAGWIHATTLGLLGMWFFYSVVGALYTLTWRYDAASFPFWVMLGLLYAYRSGLESNRNELNQASEANLEDPSGPQAN